MPDSKPASLHQTPHPTTPRPAKKSDPKQVLDFAIESARLLFDDKCEEVMVLDVRGKSVLSDYIVLGSGSSDRQMTSVLEHVEELGDKTGFSCYHRAVDQGTKWLLADFVDVVVHLFEPNTRAHYDIEMLWGDAPHISWERPDQLRRDRAGLGR